MFFHDEPKSQFVKFKPAMVINMNEINSSKVKMQSTEPVTTKNNSPLPTLESPIKWRPRGKELVAASDTRILVLDGATGTALQDLQLTAEDFGGAEYEGCNENLVLTRPDIVAYVHKLYLEAGCDIVETNTFGATPIVLSEYRLGHRAYEINRLAAEIARETCAAFEKKHPDKMKFVAGSFGPTTKSLSLTGGITFEELVDNYYVQACGLLDGGVDYFLFETCNDTRNVKAGLIATDKLFAERGFRIPVAVSGTIENTGTMLAGQSVDALIASLQNHDLFYLGLNCATGPEFMTDHIRTLARLSPFRVACVPNAGLPDEDGCYLETPDMVGQILNHFIDQGWINLVGGCCGTHKGHIHSLSELVKNKKPRLLPQEKRSNLSGIDYLEITDDIRPVIVGERTNVIGSRKFKELISSEKFEEASEIARLQVKSGAQIIDVCLANPDRDELSDVENFLEFVVKKIRVPLMIDSTDAHVIEKALPYCQGKAIINSINLEDGEERFAEIVPLAKKFGAALVVGTIDEDPVQGMAVSRERKLGIAERSFDLLTKKYGFPAEDIYFDPLVFPCGTGDEQYRTSAPETIEGLRLIKQKFPMVKTVLGISNVSFGLPAAGREVLNSVFLYHCVQAGLDLAIVNSEKLERFAKIPKEEVELAENLLMNRGEDPVAAFAAKFRERKVSISAKDKMSIPLDERLGNYILEGTKDGLVEDLEEARRTRAPLDIINGPLMAGMEKVGKLFNENKLIVAEVLQSAEAMKAAVSHLEQFMEKTETSTRGKILLATVKGDVHDIGKNLVDIILSNNGYKVINLGIKIPPEQLIAAAREHSPDMIGLSGLLVKSAQQMVTTAEDLARAGISVPVLVGGAALSKAFTEKRITPAYGEGLVVYAKDAMNGLELANKISTPEDRQALVEVQKQRLLSFAADEEKPKDHVEVELPDRSPAVRLLEANPQPLNYDRHVQKNESLEHIWKFINPMMLYTRHLGIKAKTAKRFDLYPEDHAKSAKERDKLKLEDPAGYQVWEKVEEVKAEYRDSRVLRPAAVFQFFRATGINNTISIYDSVDMKKVIGQFHFQRQNKGDFLCLADFLSRPDGPIDNMAFFVTTVGENLRETAEELKNKGEYLKCHILQALALETAEAYAEYLHSFIRTAWGFSDPIEMTMMERFQAKYTGKRYSFGYPACPRLEDQSGLFELLKPQDIGVQLTEGCMMDPEASVSAMVFHHPDAKYFGVSNDSET